MSGPVSSGRAGPPPVARPPVRLLLCDDHAVVRAGLKALLSSADGIEVVGEAGTGEEALALAARLRPDVVLMDLQLGDGVDGVTATRRLTAPPAGTESRGTEGHGTEGSAAPAPRVLVLTMFDTDADISRAIEAGATGYLLKAERPEELFAAIRDAASGRTALSAPVADRLMAQLRSPRPALSEREHEILGQLARGLGNREIARALFISEATVKTHLGRIYAKLGVETRAGAVAVAKERRLLS
ncbi:response regulator transcription factor [Streptomyces scabiei]|uniref:response regulator n=1 Tax=Streptomyces scabiei TaxID=1930 RepID=UPI001B300BEB|nr:MULTISPECIES: response regulator transcription factor [Streptomyces]MBP5870940.1 response regulator transcription factor [Streptomyces sp. LBUM 1485]MBP5913160.1 response regulator transcription factor [Streptomyces sp. LBUM 1486]MDX3034487.1 response regulator transcription factor [Streptomyces scabiei]MDX3209660.1 response regulator transcription factor [Streptomyces scabiei]QTU57421.1 response regulator transcription factor [Streptomyces sp. LBUM 1480]